MHDVTTEQNQNGEHSYQTRTGGHHVILRDVQRYLPVSGEYFPELPEGLMPTLRVSWGGNVHHACAICTLISLTEAVVSLWSFPGSYSLMRRLHTLEVLITG